MKKEFVLKKCMKCGAMVEVIQDCTCDNCGIRCCGEEMKKVVANSSDGSVEKHLPVVEIIGSYIVVTVPHVIDEDHYIEYIALDSDTINAKKYLTIGGVAKAVFPYIPNSTVYSYCNKHGLWQTEVK